MRKALLVLLMALAASFTGCLANKSTTNLMTQNTYTKELIFDSSVSKQSVIEEIKKELEKSSSVIPKYNETLRSETYDGDRTHNMNGVYIAKFQEIARGKHEVLLVYKNGYKIIDRRHSQYPSLYPNYEYTGMNTAKIVINTQSKSDGTHFYITSLPNVVLKEAWGEKPYSIATVEQDLNERVASINISIPSSERFSGEVTLKNNDETAFANVQRLMKNAFVTTNKKNDSEKSGTVRINGVNVNFSIYPYRSVSKLHYNFTYKYQYSDNGKNSKDNKIKTKIQKKLTDVMNS